MAKRASEDLFDQLHSMLTVEIIDRIKSGEATTADLRAAIDWLKVNGITGVPVSGSPLASLLAEMPDLTFDEVQRHI
jgi:orotate phosphoribosyltransferase-like protein